MFKKLLIANRGEIAVRVIRACHEMGIDTVAVYSEVDRAALHVRMADEAFEIGPASSTQSYLAIDKIVNAAVRSRAEAVHPGYGFLAENAQFARACREANLAFIGPSAESIGLMGSKIEARRAAAAYNVPMVPGTLDPVTNDAEAFKIAASIGYPIMLKASAGGGGKGLRFVANSEQLGSSLITTRAEAMAAFGDDAIYIEKFVEHPRHIEIQVLADQHGNAIYIGERECTIQRRHQKVIEECPSPIVDEALRRRMGQAALNVARAAKYYNAGTVEFLVDANRNFYFLEMNTRLQVEHPVTEMVCGIDLVKEQIRISAGHPLTIRQEEVNLRGAAIECRVYAEDPENNFLPSPGKITRLRQPSGPGIRDDSGVYEGWTVPIHYDPLISKLVAWGQTRDEAINRMKRALSEYKLDGIRTNLKFFAEILNHPDFRSGDFDTGFIDRWLESRVAATDQSVVEQDLAVIVTALAHSQRLSSLEPTTGQESSWKKLGRIQGLRNNAL